MGWLSVCVTMIVAMLAVGMQGAATATERPPAVSCRFDRQSAEVTPVCQAQILNLINTWYAGPEGGRPFTRVLIASRVGSARVPDEPNSYEAHDLSERRAAAIRRIFILSGIPERRITLQHVNPNPWPSGFFPMVEITLYTGLHARCQFALGSATLASPCREALRILVRDAVEMSRGRPEDLELEINGFADDREARTGRASLASQRAEAIAQAMRRLGINTPFTVVRGHGPDGEYRPTDEPDQRMRAVGVRLGFPNDWLR